MPIDPKDLLEMTEGIGKLMESFKRALRQAIIDKAEGICFEADKAPTLLIQATERPLPQLNPIDHASLQGMIVSLIPTASTQELAEGVLSIMNFGDIKLLSSANNGTLRLYTFIPPQGDGLFNQIKQQLSAPTPKEMPLAPLPQLESDDDFLASVSFKPGQMGELNSSTDKAITPRFQAEDPVFQPLTPSSTPQTFDSVVQNLPPLPEMNVYKIDQDTVVRPRFDTSDLADENSLQPPPPNVLSDFGSDIYIPSHKQTPSIREADVMGMPISGLQQLPSQVSHPLQTPGDMQGIGLHYEIPSIPKPVHHPHELPITPPSPLEVTFNAQQTPDDLNLMHLAETYKPSSTPPKPPVNQAPPDPVHHSHEPRASSPILVVPAIVEATISFGALVPGESIVRTGTFPIDPILEDMVRRKASDLHLTMQEPLCFRIDGEIHRSSPDKRITEDQMKSWVLPIMPPRNRDEFAKIHDTDFAYELPGVARFRVNVFRDRMGVGAVLRQIPDKVLSADDLGLPPAIRKLCELNKGLVVVTGPTGSGKSTTLAAMIDLINETRADHILTIEDPIEFVHKQKKCLINQREVHRHTQSFSRALRAALREDPDIILIGEMRDLETVAIAIETAETGHLVFGTLHTNTAISTVDRLIEQFPAEQQAQIRVSLAESLKGVVAQNLIKKKGGGRCAAQEILIVDKAVSSLIREGHTHMMANQMQTQKSKGNALLNDSLLALIQKGLVEPKDAYAKAIDKEALAALLQAKGIHIEGVKAAS